MWSNTTYGSCWRKPRWMSKRIVDVWCSMEYKHSGMEFLTVLTLRLLKWKVIRYNFKYFIISYFRSSFSTCSLLLLKSAKSVIVCHYWIQSLGVDFINFTQYISFNFNKGNKSSAAAFQLPFPEPSMSLTEPSMSLAARKDYYPLSCGRKVVSAKYVRKFCEI